MISRQVSCRFLLQNIVYNCGAYLTLFIVTNYIPINQITGINVLKRWGVNGLIDSTELQFFCSDEGMEYLMIWWLIWCMNKEKWWIEMLWSVDDCTIDFVSVSWCQAMIFVRIMPVVAYIYFNLDVSFDLIERWALHWCILVCTLTHFSFSHFDC